MDSFKRCWELIQKFWHNFKKFGEFMASIMNFFFLLPVYFVGIGITVLCLKLTKTEAFSIEKKEGTNSYWKEYDLKTKKREEYQRMF